MTLSLAALTFLLGGLGAVTRYGVLALCAHAVGPFPAGIVAVNTLAAFVGSALGAAASPENILIGVGTGFVGGLGTLSSLCSEVISLAERRKGWQIFFFIVLTLVTGIAATLLGLAVGEAFHA